MSRNPYTILYIHLSDLQHFKMEVIKLIMYSFICTNALSLKIHIKQTIIKQLLYKY